jgi:hypothetical protein
MADVFGNVTLPLTGTETETLLYTCPEVIADIDQGSVDAVVTYAQQAVTQTQITSMIACCYATGDTYTVWLTPGTDSPTTETSPDRFLLFATVSVALNTSDVISPGIVMSPGQTLWAGSTTTSTMNLTLNYIEIS